MVGLGTIGSCGVSVRILNSTGSPLTYTNKYFFIRLGPTALAAQSILLVSASTTYQAPFALGMAASVRLAFFLLLICDTLAVTLI